MKFLRRALICILPAVLLLAQHGALAHALSHLGETSSPAHEKTLIHLKLCGKCVSAEKFSPAMPPGGFALAEAVLRYALPEFVHHAKHAASPAAYRTRAPPVLV